MAELPPAELVFGLPGREEGEPACPDCGERRAVLPAPLPGVADDFDWAVRDYDSFRLFMMQELAHRSPARTRWTPADMEVVIVELLAAALDRASDALDRVQAERFLDTARRPESVRRLLQLIGYDATARVDRQRLVSLLRLPDDTAAITDDDVEAFWRLDPEAMDEARAEGPRLIFEQRRMVTADDHVALLEEHPIVARALARPVRTSPWTSMLVAIVLEAGIKQENPALDLPLHTTSTEIEGDPPNLVDHTLWQEVEAYHAQHVLPLPPANESLTARKLLRGLIERARMVGTEVFLEDAKPASIAFTLSVRAKRGHFRSELKQALEEVFAADEGGFFEPGRLAFGQDLYASDIIEAAMAVEGVAVACLNRFRRLGPYPDALAAGVIEAGADEYIQCLNRSGDPQAGYRRILVNGGELG